MDVEKPKWRKEYEIDFIIIGKDSIVKKCSPHKQI